MIKSRRSERSSREEVPISLLPFGFAVIVAGVIEWTLL
jgi:hypothetical protein